MMELKNHRVARPDEIRCKDCRCGVQMVRNSILGMPGCCGYGWTCIYYLPERIATEHHMTCDLAERKCRQMNDQDRTMCNLQKLENDLLRKRVLELEEMLKQSMHNNDELRNDNYQLRALVKELKTSNSDLLEALKDCCVIARPGNPSSCCPVYRPGEHGGCAENEGGECDVWKAIQKARGAGVKDYGKTVKFTSEDLIKTTGSDFVAEYNKFFGKVSKKEIQGMKTRIAELERQVQDYKEENVKLLQTLLALYRAVKKANCEMDKIEESYDNNAWFSRLKERTY